MPHEHRPDCTIIAGHRVLFIMAAQPEYGPHLKARINPLMTGIGPIEASIRGALGLGALARENALPDLVISLGSAGSRTCPLGEVFQVASVSWRDIDASPFGFAKGVTPLVDHPVDVPLHAPLDWPTARLSTGGKVIAGDEYAEIDADMVDMETFALARACHTFGVPLMGLRGISDGPEPPSGLHTWTNLLGHLDEELARAVDQLPAALARTPLIASRQG